MEIFDNLIKDQWCYGGKKYAGTKEKETTDILVEDYGWDWLVGTVNKYVYRYNNLAREKDLLKIACYQFIKWLKLGYHISHTGTATIQCTTVETKEKYWQLFLDRYDSYVNSTPEVVRDRNLLLQELTYRLKDMRLTKSEENLFEVYELTEDLWKLDGFAMAAKHNTDTWNEGKK